MKKHLKNIDLHKYDQAVKFLTRPFDNNLSFDQALAIQTLIDKVEFLQQKDNDNHNIPTGYVKTTSLDLI